MVDKSQKRTRADGCVHGGECASPPQPPTPCTSSTNGYHTCRGVARSTCLLLDMFLTKHLFKLLFHLTTCTLCLFYRRFSRLFLLWCLILGPGHCCWCCRSWCGWCGWCCWCAGGLVPDRDATICVVDVVDVVHVQQYVKHSMLCISQDTPCTEQCTPPQTHQHTTHQHTTRKYLTVVSYDHPGAPCHVGGAQAQLSSLGGCLCWTAMTALIHNPTDAAWLLVETLLVVVVHPHPHPHRELLWLLHMHAHTHVPVIKVVVVWGVWF